MSKIAKDGFNEELFIVDILNNNEELIEKLKIFINNEKIEKNAKLIKGNKKSDINISNINIQHKKTKLNQFGQVDRHYVEHLIEKIPELDCCKIMLKSLCELPINPITKLCDKEFKIKKINTINYSKDEINNIIKIFNKNKKSILNYIFNGFEEVYKPNLFSVTIFNKQNERERIIFWKINDIIDYLMNFEVKIRKSRTVIEISNGLTFQRKGGDCGKKQSNNFQFKFIPTVLPIDKALVYNL